ncbi:MAG TPA: efflux RND transporter periplasmic adaptor subunit [Bryobacteraceae bacterium]
MREETTNPATRGSEESLRAEIDDLKRQLAQSHKAARPSNSTVRNLVLLAVIILIGAFVIGYLPRHRRQLQLVAEADTQKEALPEVSFVPVTRAAVTGNLVLPGNIQAVTEAPVLARAEGFVNKRYVDIGDRVAAGQLLAEIEAPDLDQQVRQAQASLQQSRADLERATAALEQGKVNESVAKVTAGRWSNLVREGIASKQENDLYQGQYQSQMANVRALDRAAAAARSSVDVAQANVDRVTDLKSYLKVKAPFAGVITLRNVDVGALVNSGNTLLFRIAQTNPLRTYVNVPQSSASDVHVGQTAMLSTSDLPERKFPGSVARTANSLDPATRTLLVEIHVANPNGKLMPGMYAQVDLNLPRKDPPLLMPSDTLVVRPEGTLVAVLGPENIVHFQRIAVGRDFGDRIEVLSGLTEGQKVIVNPNDSVQEGVKVHPSASPEGAGAKRPSTQR